MWERRPCSIFALIYEVLGESHWRVHKGAEGLAKVRKSPSSSWERGKENGGAEGVQLCGNQPGGYLLEDDLVSGKRSSGCGAG